MSYNSEVKRDCIFYDEYQDMGARADLAGSIFMSLREGL